MEVEGRLALWRVHFQTVAIGQTDHGTILLQHYRSCERVFATFVPDRQTVRPRCVSLCDECVGLVCHWWRGLLPAHDPRKIGDLPVRDRVTVKTSVPRHGSALAGLTNGKISRPIGRRGCTDRL